MNNKLKNNDYIIIVLAIFLAINFYILDYGKTWKKDLYYDEKFEAAMLMQSAMEVIKEERIKKNILIDKNIDINEIGIIGVEYSPITTTLGSLESKRTSANPNFAAVVVAMMKDLELKKGDYIGVNLSGSFPGLNIAVLAAAQTLNLKLVVISSAGASTYGANIPEFNYIHMEELLYDKKIILTKSIANSLGGNKDTGLEMDEDVKKMLLNQLVELNRNIILEENLEENIRKRYDLYKEAGKKRIKCFINVGGNIVSLGNDGDWHNIGSGIIRAKANSTTAKSGIIGRFLSEGIPVINMISVKQLALEYGLPIDPYPMPQPGEGRIYYKYNYSIIILLLVFITAIIAIYLYGRRVRANYGR
ncbi:MAG: poly-gamma-glutamate system protein [Lutispora sp.]|nr:poly-gamma-glutamate system protein [Lutispora sp.]